MGEDVLADFKAKYSKGSSLGREIEFIPCRIILSRNRVLVVTSDDKQNIPIKNIFDIRKSNIPEKIQDFVSNAVSIGYKHKKEKKAVLIATEEEKLKKFINILYKILLSGVKVYVKNPAKRGGVIVESDWNSSNLKISEGRIEFKESYIDIASVRDVEIIQRNIREDKKDILSVTYFKNGSNITTYFYIEDNSIFNILGRYIRKEYSELIEEIKEIELSNGEKETIVALYSGVSEEQLPRVLKKEVDEIKSLIYSLSNKQLLQRQNGELKLTKQGNVIANKNIEEVNV